MPLRVTDLRTSATEAAATPGSVVRRLAVRDNGGTILGYLPLYDSIT